MMVRQKHVRKTGVLFFVYQRKADFVIIPA